MLFVVLLTMALSLSPQKAFGASLSISDDVSDDYENYTPELSSEIVNETDTGIILDNASALKSLLEDSQGAENRELAGLQTTKDATESHDGAKFTSNASESTLDALLINKTIPAHYNDEFNIDQSSSKINSSIHPLASLPENASETTSDTIHNPPDSHSETNDNSSEAFIDHTSRVPTFPKFSTSEMTGKNQILITKIDTTENSSYTSGKEQTVYTKSVSLSESTIKSTSSFMDTTSENPEIVDDYILVEMIRLVFQGNVVSHRLPNKVYALLESFLTRAARELKAKDGSDWSFQLSSTLQPISFENTTYMDFRITHTAKQEISFMFKRLHLRSFISQNSNLILLAECWRSHNCQNISTPDTPPLTVFEKNVSVFTTVIVLSCACLAVLVAGTLCARLSRATGSLKADKNKTKNCSGGQQKRTASQNQASNVQTTKEETVRETAFNGDTKDPEVSLQSTWVISLDEVPGEGRAVVVVTTEDTKL